MTSPVVYVGTMCTKKSGAIHWSGDNICTRRKKSLWGYSRKIQTGGLRIWNFKGYQINSTWNFQGLIKKEVEFPSVTKKKECGISRGLCFWLWNVQRI